ncbi:hypothetical protein D4764_03G0001740 [Takifugu flavidus]|uniref:Uncharacterized protein n=1 Tax=Takifugu flavidus TaxID=433684 RepID=A0A5C6N723_9TELE|nr:hypothetical protein D4764_03G0001740 [Takifugu flavidus]
MLRSSNPHASALSGLYSPAIVSSDPGACVHSPPQSPTVSRVPLNPREDESGSCLWSKHHPADAAPDVESRSLEAAIAVRYRHDNAHGSQSSKGLSAARLRARKSLTLILLFATNRERKNTGMQAKAGFQERSYGERSRSAVKAPVSFPLGSLWRGSWAAQ